MAGRNVKPRSYCEPWAATKSKTWESAFRHGPPSNDHLEDEADRKNALGEWESARARAEQNADWLIWGSNISDPAICTGLSGAVTVLPGDRIIAVSKMGGAKPNVPDHEAFARRIVACVNACAGIGDPEGFVRDARAFFLAVMKGDFDGDPREDPRVLSLLARCIPPAQLEGFDAASLE